MKDYKKESSLNELISQTLASIKTIADSSTVFGEKIETREGNVVIPVSKLTIGFVLGGGEYADLSTRRVGSHYPMAGGSGGGMTLTPVGFLVSTSNEIKFINTEKKSNEIFDSLNKIASYLKSKSVKEEKNEE